MATSATRSTPNTSVNSLSTEAVLQAVSGNELLLKQQVRVYVAIPSVRRLETVRLGVWIDNLTCPEDYLSLFVPLSDNVYELELIVGYTADDNIVTLDFLPRLKDPMIGLFTAIGSNLRHVNIILIGYKDGRIQNTSVIFERIADGPWEQVLDTLNHPYLPVTTST
ncbi:uncharacterized protein BDZ99DRAFT_521151 [Mytilinidion resinicola]|uniref:Uncharacterized protein n=1 Tax=Mytilinidion resinicola TaxID=574789 RepID=A0A6A6YLT4_9PEZI|nr:uncharacterized protein BDZ99DRAFT_521151 [Mytilinidion resinicola]KAF2809836.1 hypothetical protein BDZ99DRAFT_521151 [Mytilinidion resinicola]